MMQSAGPGKQSEGSGRTPGDGYAKIEGRDQASVEAMRTLEARVSQKTASDYAHVVWAYGILWALFAGYGILLWRRASRVRDEAADLRRRLDGVK